MRQYRWLRLFGLFLWPCVVYADTLRVAAAANMQYAFAALQRAFEVQSGHRVLPSYAASGQLTTQIMHGAPFDVFLSADTDYPAQIERAGLAVQAPQIYAYGKLVLWTRSTQPLPDWSAWLIWLQSTSVRKIAVANPRVAPYGAQAMQVLRQLNLYPLLRNKLVFGESIAQTSQYIDTQAVEVGFSAQAIVAAPDRPRAGQWIAVPDTLYQPLAQAVVVLKQGQQTHPMAVAQFLAFLTSNEAGQLLLRYGYQLPH